MDIAWSDDDDGKHYEAAEHYLALVCADANGVLGLLSLLRHAEITEHRCNDVLRASGLARLTDSDKAVAKDLKKIKEATPLQPVLLVRNGRLEHRTGISDLTVADGYHRLCAIAFLDPDAVVRAKLV